MPLVRECLDDAKCHVLLHEDILADIDDLAEFGQEGVGVVVAVDGVDVGEAVEVVADQLLEVPSVLLVAGVVLHADPEAVHLLQVGQDEVHGRLQVFRVQRLHLGLRQLALAVLLLVELGGVETAGDRQLVLEDLVEVVAHEHALDRVLDALGHLEHVEHDLLGVPFVRLDPDAAHRDQQLDPRDGVARVLHGLLQLVHFLLFLQVALLELPLYVFHVVEYLQLKLIL